MNRTPRPLVNGTAITLAIIAVIITAIVGSRSCSSGDSTHAPSPTSIPSTLPPDTLQLQKTHPDSTSAKKKPADKKANPKTTPERSPLDEKV